MNAPLRHPGTGDRNPRAPVAIWLWSGVLLGILGGAAYLIFS